MRENKYIVEKVGAKSPVDSQSELGTSPKLSGFIYFIASFPGSEGNNLVKVGYTGNVRKRIETFRTALPFEIELLTTMPGTKADEKRIHALLSKSRFGREWFRYDDRVVELIDDLQDAATLLQMEHGDDYRPSIGECLDYKGARDGVDGIIIRGLQAMVASDQQVNIGE